MQYCIILEVDSSSEATTAGMLLHGAGYRIVSTQLTPSHCPATPGDGDHAECPAAGKKPPRREPKQIRARPPQAE